MLPPLHKPSLPRTPPKKETSSLNLRSPRAPSWVYILSVVPVRTKHVMSRIAKNLFESSRKRSTDTTTSAEPASERPALPATMSLRAEEGVGGEGRDVVRCTDGKR
eukprot:scaffold83818_cov35-Tisochrysis_lutea.AAC.6